MIKNLRKLVLKNGYTVNIQRRDPVVDLEVVMCYRKNGGSFNNGEVSESGASYTLVNGSNLKGFIPQEMDKIKDEIRNKILSIQEIEPMIHRGTVIAWELKVSG